MKILVLLKQVPEMEKVKFDVEKGCFFRLFLDWFVIINIVMWDINLIICQMIKN